jgi:FdhD protein
MRTHGSAGQAQMITREVASQRVPTLIVRGGSVRQQPDAVAGEEPLQIRAAGPGQEPEDVAITMRTPGSEEELAIGFLVAEGLVEAADVKDATFTRGDPALISRPENEVLVRLSRPLRLEAVAHRHFVATASCGICGRASIDELIARVKHLPSGLVVARSVLAGLPGTMREVQSVFDKTGGLHAAALFKQDGSLIAAREDIGRHNAVDKLVGSQALAGALPAHDSVLLVSGRLSFEIVQKAAAAGIPMLCAVSAASDLAISTAERVGMTLVGFLRGDGLNIYCGAERIDLNE